MIPLTHEVLVAFVSAAVSACAMPMLRRLWRRASPEPPPFEPGLCEELPLHPWDWQQCDAKFHGHAYAYLAARPRQARP